MLDATIENEIVTVQGIKGYGKTNGVKCMVSNKPKVFTIDIRHEYKHFQHYYKFNDFILALYHKSFAENEFKVAFTFNTKSEYIKLFYFLQAAGKCTLIIDEADSLFQIREFHNPLFNLFLGARNKQVDLFL